MRRTDGRYHARIGFHTAAALAASAAGRRVESADAPADRKGGAIDSGAAAARWRLQHLLRRTVGRQRHRQSLHRTEAGRTRPARIRGWPARASAFWRWAAFRPPTATSKSISACSTCFRATIAPPFRRKWCCCPSSSSTRCRRGRAPSSFRFPSCMPPIRAGRCPRGSIWMSCSCPASTRHSACDAGWFTWRNLFLRIDRILKWWERYGSKSLRRKAMQTAEKWMLERFAGLRRSGRHLSAHDVRHHGAGCSGLCARIIPRGRRRCGSSITCSPTTASASSSSRAFRRSGTRRSRRMRWVKRRCRAHRAGAASARATGCSRRRSGARATGA